MKGSGLIGKPLLNSVLFVALLASYGTWVPITIVNTLVVVSALVAKWLQRMQRP